MYKSFLHLFYILFTMKNKSLKGFVILSALLFMQTACRQADKDRLANAIQYEQKGSLYQTENKWDSAIANYYKSYQWYSLLATTAQALTQNEYTSKQTQLAYKLACCYQIAHDYNNAILYAGFAYNGSKKLQQTDSCIADEILTGFLYYQSAQTKQNNSAEQMKAYQEGAIYIYPAVGVIDSLGWDRQYNEGHNKLALYAYAVAQSLFNKTGDTDKEKFCHDKYYALYVKMNGHAPGTHQ